MFLKSNLSFMSRRLFITTRNLTATEISTALRPFYFSVHPDLFGQHPRERAINETSLQQLSSVLQSLQTSKCLSPVTLSFYVKNNRSHQSDSLRLVRIYLKEEDLGSTIVNILKACDLPTNHLQHYLKNNTGGIPDKTRLEKDQFVRVKFKNEFDFTKLNKNHPLYATFGMQQKMKETKENLRLWNWLQHNFKDALKKCKSGSASREEINQLKKEMIRNSKLKDIRWDCGWNGTHFRGCLLSLKSLMDQHPQHIKLLEDRILIFSHFTGVSLDGHIMLFSGEVRHNWLDFIKNIRIHEGALKRVPFYEKSLSHVLRNIKVARRKFMPEVKVSEYEANLKQLTTSLSDYLGCNKYPASWPKSLEKFEIVVESEAGPLMVSPTGQFIAPAAIPGRLLISFISANLTEAEQRIAEYKRDKVLEVSLYNQCMEELQLGALLKDDNIYPELMIQCCQKLLENKEELKIFTKDLNLNVSTYYSVLSDGVVCIPWNFNL